MTIRNIFPKKEPYGPYEQERLRQSRWSFNTLIGLCTLTGLVSIFGIILLILGKIPPGIITAGGGLSSNIFVIERLHKLTKESNNIKLDD